MEEAFARAIATVTTATAQEVAANATAAGEDYDSAATPAAAAVVWEEERCATMGSRFDTPSVVDGNDTTAEVSAAVATAAENGYKSALKTDDGTPAKGVTTGAAVTANGNGNAAKSAQRGPNALEEPSAPPAESPYHYSCSPLSGSISLRALVVCVH